MNDARIATARPDGRTFSLTTVLRQYGVLIIIGLLLILLTFASDSFLTPRNLLNIINQSAPLMIIACALTLVIIGGGFDLSTGAIFGVAAVSAGWIATNIDPYLGLIAGPVIGLVLGILNGLIITTFNVHSFLVTLATSLVYRGIAILITGGSLIPVRIDQFSWLGRGRIGMVNIAIIVLVIFMAIMMILLNRTTFGRRVFAVGGNEEAAILSGIRTNLVKTATFAISGAAAGLAGIITVSRLSMAEPQAGAGFELEAIAAVILGGTAITGGAGAIWRSVAGVLLMALIGNGFNILNVNPFFKDLTTGVIIVIAVALAANRSRR
ncbi:ABC transporter permease [Agrobacterium rubi]|uniref:Autoinducer 2 import system permease protein LsrD n=1 Tax=Agrobacterium rubi TaxID=28099 RepID=A0AAE7R4G8_9HYPH|nr:ABC transporter permease [Agrobacterium rubi]MCL6654702.1 ABC transporter permease [Agrobacterium rubi]NTE88060.1 ABC transporter permease [Agrobacterium rubi]NTF03827.1 ABC transporter permease [Agrobacterium rubi]NTF09091.1 ABC transporter permease [Agrobacterium rubi]NTF21362.1 ABC transporter permease [Agrobacterium rubi]